MGKLTDLLKAPAAPTKESLERLRARLEEMDALLDEVSFLRVENAELRGLLSRYRESEDMDAWRYRMMVENGIVPSEWHEIITSAREGFRQRADASFDESFKDLCRDIRQESPK